VRVKAKRYLFSHLVVAGADSFSTNPPEGEVPEFRPGADPRSAKWYQPIALQDLGRRRSARDEVPKGRLA
ncbi:hypothetical protein ACVSMY_26665, partial [Pseudomonas aeruginosa]